MTLDWPVDQGGTVVVRPGEEAAWSWREGSGPATRVRLASVTKLLSALGALAAVEHGHVRLDEPVDEQGATLRHLLAHAGGYPGDAGGRHRPVGQRRIYSNAGFRLAAQVVEDAVGVGFGTWVDAQVIGPLGMAATAFEEWGGRAADAAAGAFGTLPDLERLARCLLDRGAPVVGPELFGEAVRVQFPGLAGVLPGVGRFDPCDWGLGFELHDGKRPHWMGERRSPQAFGHFGATGCFVWVDPAVPLAAAALTDRDFDQGWAMRTWPAWSDRLPAAG